MAYAKLKGENSVSATAHSSMWWVGQISSLMLALSLLWHGYGGPVAAAVGYALAVLVDIRELVGRRVGDA